MPTGSFGVVYRMSGLGENLIQAACPLSGAGRASPCVRKWVVFCQTAFSTNAVLASCRLLGLAEALANRCVWVVSCLNTCGKCGLRPYRTSNRSVDRSKDG